jgi:four helix bundle protein
MGKGFRDLKVWQNSKDLAVYIYKVTNAGPFSKDYGLRDQIRRAAVSVASNIAEGDERDTNRDSVRFLYMAKGSVAEVITQTIISKDIGYLKNDEFNCILEQCEMIGKMLGKLIKARKVQK